MFKQRLNRIFTKLRGGEKGWEQKSFQPLTQRQQVRILGTDFFGTPRKAVPGFIMGGL